jgi:hypothetical protein
MGDSNVDGDGSEVDGYGGGVDGVHGDSSGGTFPSQQGAGKETFVPRNWSSTVVALLGETPINLGFLHQRLFIDGEAMSEGG